MYSKRAERTPDTVAQIYQGVSTTYAELNERANQCAQGLIAEGCKPDSRVAYMGKNNSGYFEMLGGAFKAKAVVVGVNWRLAGPEVAYVLNDSKSEILFVTEDFYPLVEQVLADCPTVRKVVAMDGGHGSWMSFDDWRDTYEANDPKLPKSAEDDVIQLYTSGTTGYPKGVQLTNANYADVLYQAEHGGWANWQEGEISLVCMPLFHVAGVNIGILGFWLGCTNIILKDVDPQEILRLMETYKINHAFMVPAVILMLLNQPNINDVDVSSLKNIIYGASPIAEDVLLRARDRFGCDFIQVYGLTETTGAATSLPPEDHDPARGKLRSCGKPNPHVEIRIVDDNGDDVAQGEVGEIIMRSPCIMKGYWNKPDATKEAVVDDWFHTGDAGFLDKDGYVFIHDRVKDMIISGGENVYPAEVENALFAHPAVADAAVIGVPDEKWGEAVKGIVVLKPGENASAEDIIAHTRTLIAGFKTPKTIDFIDALPRNPSGKVLRRELRAPYWDGKGRQVG
ncbi:MAG: fatty acid--CoA ligase [Alphaproteobacteria bacterium]|nr:MAG: fatty acid--CoA ligase [Alphaproteobacteria bacterium]